MTLTYDGYRIELRDGAVHVHYPTGGSCIGLKSVTAAVEHIDRREAHRFEVPYVPLKNLHARTRA